MKIGFMGTHGTGKTTRARAMAAQLKAKDPAKRLTLLSDVARSCPLPVNEKTSDLARRWIFHRQMTREVECVAQNDIVVCDRTILDMAYARRAGFDFVEIYLPVALRGWRPIRRVTSAGQPAISPKMDFGVPTRGFRPRLTGFSRSGSRLTGSSSSNATTSKVPNAIFTSRMRCAGQRVASTRLLDASFSDRRHVISCIRTIPEELHVEVFAQFHRAQGSQAQCSPEVFR